VDTHSLALISTLLLVFSAAIIGGVVAKLLKQPMVLAILPLVFFLAMCFQKLPTRDFKRDCPERRNAPVVYPGY